MPAHEANSNNAPRTGSNITMRLREVRRILLKNCAHHLNRGFPAESALAGEHFIKNRAEGKNIGARVGGLAAHLLRRHISNRNHHGSSVGGYLLRGRVAGSIVLRTGEFGEAEVENFCE